VHIIIFLIFIQQRLAGGGGILFPALRQYLFVGRYLDFNTMSIERKDKDYIVNFIEILYSIAIGIGFTEFPIKPHENLPNAILFFVILFIAAKDWFYYHEFQKLVTPEKKFQSNIVQIISVLILSQLFKQEVIGELRLWIFYLIIFIVAGIYWNWLVAFSNYRAINKINAVIVFFNAVLLFLFPYIQSLSSLSNAEFRYLVLGYELVVIAASYQLFR
jgi:hypothetical protein